MLLLYPGTLERAAAGGGGGGGGGGGRRRIALDEVRG
jgi:hypothetical protein